MVIFWMDLFYGFRLDKVSPVKLAPQIHVPVLIIHGKRDPTFALHHALRLQDSFPAGKTELFVVSEGEHSTCSLAPDYPDGITAFVNRYLPMPGEHT
jgi:pimeloyl-ACP methyl ester carboxylesterase